MKIMHIYIYIYIVGKTNSLYMLQHMVCVYTGPWKVWWNLYGTRTYLYSHEQLVLEPMGYTKEMGISSVYNKSWNIFLCDEHLTDSAV